MHVTLVHIHVRSEYLDAFIDATRANHEASTHEPGNLRFDILQSPDQPTHFVFYEAYETQEQAAAHKNTAHYLLWRDTVAPWMEEPRQGTSYQGLMP